MNVESTKGLKFPARTIVAEEALSVANYARVLCSPERAFYSSEAANAAGYAGRPLPPAMLMFFNTLSEKDLTDTLGVSYGRTLLAGAEFEFSAVAATERDTIVGQTVVESASERTGRDGQARQFMTLVTEFQTIEGVPISRSKATFIERVGGVAK